MAAARLEAAIAKAVLHHLHDHELDATLKGVARVLTPGGHLLIQDGTRLSPDRARQMNRALAAAGHPPRAASGS